MQKGLPHRVELDHILIPGPKAGWPQMQCGLLGNRYMNYQHLLSDLNADTSPKPLKTIVFVIQFNTTRIQDTRCQYSKKKKVLTLCSFGGSAPVELTEVEIMTRIALPLNKG